jgi:hypothetical protein
VILSSSNLPTSVNRHEGISPVRHRLLTSHPYHHAHLPPLCIYITRTPSWNVLSRANPASQCFIQIIGHDVAALPFVLFFGREGREREGSGLMDGCPPSLDNLKMR